MQLMCILDSSFEEVAKKFYVFLYVNSLRDLQTACQSMEKQLNWNSFIKLPFQEHFKLLLTLNFVGNRDKTLFIMI